MDAKVGAEIEDIATRVDGIDFEEYFSAFISPSLFVVCNHAQYHQTQNYSAEIHSDIRFR